MRSQSRPPRDQSGISNPEVQYIEKMYIQSTYKTIEREGNSAGVLVFFGHNNREISCDKQVISQSYLNFFLDLTAVNLLLYFKEKEKGEEDDENIAKKYEQNGESRSVKIM